MWVRVIVSLCTLSLAGCHLIFPFNAEQPNAVADAAPKRDGAPDAPPELDGTADAPPEHDGATPVPEPEVVWASQSKGTGASACIAQDVVVDAAYKTYVVGQFIGTVNFGAVELTSKGSSDAFVAGYDLNGKNLWVRQLGGAGAVLNAAQGVALAPNGDVLVTGFVSGSTTFGAITPTVYAKKDAFVARLSGGGTPQWIVRIGGAEDDMGEEVVVTDAGKVHVVGSSTGPIASGPKSAPGVAKGDGFMATLDSGGQTKALVTFGGAEDDRFGAAALDDQSQLIVAGEYTGALTIGSGSTGVYGVQDLLVARYKTTAPTLVVSMGGAGVDRANGLALGALNAIYLVGNFYGQANLGSGTMGQPGKSNGYLVKRQSNGMNGWARTTETGTTADLRGLTLDSKGRPCVVGSFRSSVTIQGNQRPAVGQTDVLVAGFGIGGNLRWLASYGAADIDMGGGIAADDQGHVYVTGHFKGGVTFSPKHKLTAGAGGRDMFLIKLKPPFTPP